MEGDTPAPSASADDASPDTSKNLANLSIGSVVNISPESITTRNKSGGGEATISKLHHDPTTGAVCKVDVKFVISGRTQKNVDVAHLSLHQEDLPKRRSRRSSAAAVNTSKEDHSKMDTETRGKDTAGEKKKTAASAKKKRNEDNEVEKKQPPKKEIDSNETDEDEDWILITGVRNSFFIIDWIAFSMMSIFTSHILTFSSSFSLLHENNFITWSKSLKGTTLTTSVCSNLPPEYFSGGMTTSAG